MGPGGGGGDCTASEYIATPIIIKGLLSRQRQREGMQLQMLIV